MRAVVSIAFYVLAFTLAACSASPREDSGGTNVTIQPATAPSSPGHSPQPTVDVHNNQPNGQVATDVEFKNMIEKLGKLADIGVQFFGKQIDNHNTVHGNQQNGGQEVAGNSAPTITIDGSGWVVVTALGLCGITVVLLHKSKRKNKHLALQLARTVSSESPVV